MDVVTTHAYSSDPFANMDPRPAASVWALPGISVCIHRIENGLIGSQFVMLPGPVAADNKHCSHKYLVSETSKRFAIVLHFDWENMPAQNTFVGDMLSIRVEMDGYTVGVTCIPKAELMRTPFVAIDRCAVNVAAGTARTFMFSEPAIGM